MSSHTRTRRSTNLCHAHGRASAGGGRRAVQAAQKVVQLVCRPRRSVSSARRAAAQRRCDVDQASSCWCVSAVRLRQQSLTTEPRLFFSSLVAAALTLVSSAVALSSPARGDTLTATRPSLSEATRVPSKAGPLPPGEQAIVDTFERLTCCVVNVVDITVAQAGMSSRVGAQVRSQAKSSW